MILRYKLAYHVADSLNVGDDHYNNMCCRLWERRDITQVQLTKLNCPCLIIYLS